MNKASYIKNSRQARKIQPDLLINKWVRVLVEYYLDKVDSKVRLMIFRLTNLPNKREIKSKI